MLKKVVAGALSALLCLCCLTGCSGFYSKSETDVAERYADYWDYALGEYTYDYEDTREAYDGGLGGMDFRTYEFKYKNRNGNEKSFKIDNLCDGRHPDKWEDFTITRISERILEEDYSDNIWLLICTNQRLMESIEKPTRDIREPLIELSKVNEDISCVDTQKGIDLKNLTLSNLSENNLTAKIIIGLTLNKSVDEYDGLEDDLTAIASSVYGRYGCKNITFHFNVQDLNKPNRFMQTYFVAYDGYEYICNEI